MKHAAFVMVSLSLMVSGCSLFRSAEIPQVAGPPEPVVVTPDPPPEVRRETFPRYDRIITREAVTDSGLFIAHRLRDRLFYEIPGEELGRDFLLVTRIARAQIGTGWGGQRINNQILRWERMDNRILLRRVSFDITADTTQAIYRAVRNATFEPIIASYPIETMSRDGQNVVIDVTRLFTTDVQEFTLRQRFRARRVDPERSFIERVRSFPDNVEVRNVLTMDVDNVPGGDPDLRTVSVMYNHSMVRLPENPMKPRLHDERVGYYSVSRIDFGHERHRAEERRYITRWRLEKKHPDSAVSEPLKPIVFYVDPATPERWVPWVIRGIEEWQDSFEKAGFRNAIVGRHAPDPGTDPDWSPEDVRYPTVRWFPSTVPNAVGPHVNDPRTGEILTSSVQLHHNVMNLLRNWYFVQASASDERARTYAFPDSLMGRLIQYVVAHEIGHALGFPHNMKASGTVPVDSLRSAEWTRRYGTTPSIMDYARMNYIAQPGDDAYLVPIVSMYDEFAVEWGYTPIPEADTPDAERPFLESIVRRQEDNPMLLFGHLSTFDPTQQREALSDNHISATRYGIENIKRIMEYLVDASGDPGDDYATLRELFAAVVLQRNRMLEHVVAWVGGVYGERKVHGQEGDVFAHVSYTRQKEAMEYLIEEGFSTPEYLLRHEVLRRIEPTGAVDRIARGHRHLLTMLLDDARMSRLTEHEAIHNDPDSVYSLGDLLDDLHTGIWRELEENEISIDIFRRNLQRTYVDILKSRLTDDIFSLDGEIRAYFRGTLRRLREAIEDAVPRAADRMTDYHLRDMLIEVNEILNDH
jgi:hypothetical protein